MASIVRLDKIGRDNHIVNFVFATDLENGRVVSLGALKTDDYETYEATAVADVTSDVIVLHASVPLNYEANKLDADFVLEAGKEGRGIHLKVGDIFTVTDDAINGTTVVGEYCIPVNNSTQLSASATFPTDAAEKLGFKVIEKTTLSGVAASTLEVIAV